MIHFSPPIYEDETMQSITARYHYYSGNINYKITSSELFGISQVKCPNEWQSGLEYFADQFSYCKEYSSEYFINNHTLFPLLSPFLFKEKSETIKNGMMGYDKNLQNKTGVISGNIHRENGLWYCPQCSIEDVDKYGEPYFHRVHQLFGVFICPLHQCLLKQYPLIYTYKDSTRLQFDAIDIKIEYEKNNQLNEFYKKIADSVSYILINNFNNHSADIVYNKYFQLLSEKELMTSNGIIDKEELIKEFRKYYGDELLNKLQSDLHIKNNWLRRGISVTPQSTILHPIRHILIILFLCNNVQRFFDMPLSTNFIQSKKDINERCKNELPFGEGPWPCLNIASDHYRHLVIDNCSIANKSTDHPKGTFLCSCGFRYTRLGPDKTYEDKFRYDYIVRYGECFGKKIEELILLSKEPVSLHELAGLLKCSYRTILKYACKLGLLKYIKTKINEENVSISQDYAKYVSREYIEECRCNLLEFIESNQDCTRNQLSSIMSKEYKYLYKLDKAWLNDNILAKVPVHRNANRNFQKIDWSKMDIQLLKKLKEIHQDLLKADKPIRISLHRIGQFIGYNNFLGWDFEKTPESKKFLSQVVETREQFQIRRIDNICERYYEENGWISVEAALKSVSPGIRNKLSKVEKDRIEENVSKFNGCL